MNVADVRKLNTKNQLKGVEDDLGTNLGILVGLVRRIGYLVYLVVCPRDRDQDKEKGLGGLGQPRVIKKSIGGLNKMGDRRRKVMEMLENGEYHSIRETTYHGVEAYIVLAQKPPDIDEIQKIYPEQRYQCECGNLFIHEKEAMFCCGETAIEPQDVWLCPVCEEPFDDYDEAFNHCAEPLPVVPTDVLKKEIEDRSKQGERGVVEEPMTDRLSVDQGDSSASPSNPPTLNAENFYHPLYELLKTWLNSTYLEGMIKKGEGRDEHIVDRGMELTEKIKGMVEPILGNSILIPISKGGEGHTGEEDNLFYIKGCPTVSSKIDYKDDEPVLVEGFFRLDIINKIKQVEKVEPI